MSFPIFVLSLDSYRRTRMLRRLQYNGLLNRTTFVSGFNREHPLVDWMHDPHLASNRGETACLLGHIKILREFVKTQEPACIVLEDDAMLHNNFNQELEKHLQHLPPSCPLLLFWGMHFYERLPDHTRAMCRPCGQLFYHIDNNQFGTWGTAGYWIRRDYALKALEKLDRPLRFIGAIRPTSELITRESGGLFTKLPLVLEEYVNTQIQEPQKVFVMRQHCAMFGYHNYLNGDGISQIEQLWGTA